jgi:hypothetical protein
MKDDHLAVVAKQEAWCSPGHRELGNDKTATRARSCSDSGADQAA